MKMFDAFAPAFIINFIMNQKMIHLNFTDNNNPKIA